MRKTLAIVLILTAGTACGGDPEEGSPGTDGGGTGADGSGDGGDDGDAGGGTTGDDGGGMTGGDGGGMTGGDDGGGFIDKNDVGGGGGAYPPCAGMCPPGTTCITADPPNDSLDYCAMTCSPPGDPSGCPPPPDGDAVPICIDVADMMGQNTQSYCVLDCSAGQTCPAGMQCIVDSDVHGPITVCF